METYYITSGHTQDGDGCEYDVEVYASDEYIDDRGDTTRLYITFDCEDFLDRYEEAFDEPYCYADEKRELCKRLNRKLSGVSFEEADIIANSEFGTPYLLYWSDAGDEVPEYELGIRHQLY